MIFCLFEQYFDKIRLRDGKLPAVQIVQGPGVGFEGESQLPGAQRLTGEGGGLFIAPVFAVPHQGVAGGGELGADLMGAAGEEPALHQGGAVFGAKGLIAR